MIALYNTLTRVLQPKRHNRNVSAQNNGQNNAPNGVASAAARPQSLYSQLNGNGYAHGHNLSEPVVPLQRDFPLASEKGSNGIEEGNLEVRAALALDDTRRTVSTTNVIPPYEARREASPPAAKRKPSPVNPVTVNLPRSPSPDNDGSPSTGSPSSSEQTTPLSTSPSRPPSTVPPIIATELRSTRQDSKVEQSDPPLVAGPSSVSPVPSATSSPGPSPRPALTSLSPSGKVSTFRRIPLRSVPSRPTVPSSPLRPQSTHLRSPSSLSTASRVLDSIPARTSETGSRMASPLAAPTSMSAERPLSSLPALELPAPAPTSTNQAYRPYTPAGSASHRPMSIASPIQTSPTSVSPSTSHGIMAVPPAISPAPSSSSTINPVTHRASTPGSRTRTPAPYRPGFQPKGVYRPRTDEFLEARKQRGDKDKVERTRLERRLEKLVNLHFPHPHQKKEKDLLNGRPAPTLNRRASSFFDIDISSLKGKSAGDLWKGVVQSQAAGGKNDIRGWCDIFNQARQLTDDYILC